MRTTGHHLPPPVPPRDQPCERGTWSAPAPAATQRPVEGSPVQVIRATWKGLQGLADFIASSTRNARIIPEKAAGISDSETFARSGATVEPR